MTDHTAHDHKLVADSVRYAGTIGSFGNDPSTLISTRNVSADMAVGELEATDAPVTAPVVDGLGEVAL